MAKEKTIFFCQECGFESAKWLGQCPGCRSWNSFVEEKVVKAAPGSKAVKKAGDRPKPVSINAIPLNDSKRTLTGIGELDRVLGGGLVDGSMTLIGGDPGIGKSTLLLQTCRNLAGAGKKVLYISGEESLYQIKMRAVRIGDISDNMELLCETDMEAIRNVIEHEKPDIAVIDSIQTMYCTAISSAPGSVSQVREATATLMQIAKGLGVSVFIVGHVTKDGSVAGPRVLEHMVDTVLYFEGDRHASYRVLRGVKNRFGSTDEIGVFEMRSDGLNEVLNPSEYMLSGRPMNVSGTIVSCSMEGTRPMLLEIQALVAKTSFGIPRRTSAGVDFNRVNLLLAVLEKRAHMDLSMYDAYINIAGGIKMNEPAVDLGIVLALASCYKDINIDAAAAAFGEVGLTGEIRAVKNAEQRIGELTKLGFRHVILPKANMTNIRKTDAINLHPVDNIGEAIKVIGSLKI
ncbi:MAG: DNA repair protein RadA [Lachnospiraceae bacterium]|nr:DNA repair protein RadA [Lachnospiraceae bacterium]